MVFKKTRTVKTIMAVITGICYSWNINRRLRIPDNTDWLEIGAVCLGICFCLVSV